MNPGQIQVEAPLPPARQPPTAPKRRCNSPHRQPPTTRHRHIGPRHVVSRFVWTRRRNKPMRPKSAFIVFSCDHRRNVQRANPQMSIPGVVRRLGEMWHAKTAAERQPYEERSQRDRERYQREMRELRQRQFGSHPWPPYQPVGEHTVHGLCMNLGPLCEVLSYFLNLCMH